MGCGLRVVEDRKTGKEGGGGGICRFGPLSYKKFVGLKYTFEVNWEQGKPYLFDLLGDPDFLLQKRVLTLSEHIHQHTSTLVSTTLVKEMCSIPVRGPLWIGQS